MGSLRLVLSTSITSVAICAAFGRASAIAYDSAGDSAYNEVYNISDGNGTSFLDGHNGGYGWGGPWQGFSDSFLGSSSTNGAGDPAGTGDVNSPRTLGGRAWTVKPVVRVEGTANVAFRAFSGALSPDQSFSIDFDNGSIPTANQFVAIGLGTATTLVNVMPYTVSGPLGVIAEPQLGGNYMVWQEGPSALAYIDTGIPITDQGVHVDFSILDGAHARMSVTSFQTGQTAFIPASYSTPIQNVEIYNGADGFVNPLQRYVYFNNIEITPEPAGSGAIVATALALLLRRRQRYEL